MSPSERQKAVSRIVSGVVLVEFSGKKYIIKEPEQIHKVIAEEIYSEKFNEAVSKGILTEEESVEQLVSMERWSTEEQVELNTLSENISTIKLELYQAYKAFKKLDSIRKYLAKTKERLFQLDKKKNVLRAHSAEALAETARFRYATCSNITDMNGNKFWGLEEYGNQNSRLIDHLLSQYLNYQLSEKRVRELCRNDPWRSLWAIGKTESGVFNRPSSELTAMQKVMLSWSRIYDSINDSPESPPDEVIEDDDLLDGWLTYQHKKREKAKNERQNSEQTTGVKGDEVFIVAEDPKAVSRVYSMNDASGKAIIRTRQKQMDKSKKGLPAEKTLDAQMEMQNQARQKFKDAVK